MAAAPVKVSFAVVGDREMVRAFRTAEARARALDKSANQNAVRQEKSADKTARAAQKAADKAARAEMAAMRKTEKAAEAHARRIEKIKERSALAAGRIAAKEAAAEIRARKRAQTARAGVIGGAFKRTGSAMWGIGSNVMMGAGLLGTAAITNGVAENVRLQHQAAMLVNATRGKKGKAALNRDQLIKETQTMASTYGVSASEIMSGLGTIAERGGGAQAVVALKDDFKDMVETAIAAGVSIEDVGAVAAAAFKSGVKPGEEMRQLMRDLVEQGKIGSVEFKDLADELPKLAAFGKLTSLTGAQMVKTQVGLAQIAVEGTATPEEARTSVTKSITDIINNQKAFKRLGVQTIDTSTNLVRDPTQIMMEAVDAAYRKGAGKGGSESMISLLTGQGGGFKKTAIPLIGQMISEYLKGAETGGAAGGRASLKKKIDETVGATMTKEERDIALKEVMSTAMAELNKSVQKFNQEMGKLMPKLTELIPHVTKLSKAFAEAVTWIADHPKGAIAGLIGGYLVKELAAAKIGELISNMLKGGGGNGSGILGGGGKLGVGNAIVGGTIAFAAGYEAGGAGFEEFVAPQMDKYSDVGTQLKVENYAAQKLFEDPTSTKEQRQRALRSLQAARAAAEPTMADMAIQGTYGNAAYLLGGMKGPKPGEERGGQLAQADSLIMGLASTMDRATTQLSQVNFEDAGTKFGNSAADAFNAKVSGGKGDPKDPSRNTPPGLR